MRFVLPILGGLVVCPHAASAEQYCWVGGFKFEQGRPVETTMKVVISTVLRPKASMGRKPADLCNLAFRSSSPFYMPITITQKPRRGELDYDSYSIGYRSMKVGRDKFAFIVHHMDHRTNKVVDTPVSVNVEVVAQPF
jgi:hypothetical protein